MGLSDFIKKIVNPYPSYDMDSIDGIRSIPLNAKPMGPDGLLDSVDYRLYRKATEHKKNGKMDLAIECLKKANDIQDSREIFSTTEKEYFRLLKYMEIAGCSKNDIESERLKMEEAHPDFFGKYKFNATLKRAIEFFQRHEYESDTVQVRTAQVCPTCSTYNMRVYSLYGKDPRFPKLPDFLTRSRCPDCPIHIGFSVYFPDFKTASDLKKDIEFSNRPFDTRKGSAVNAIYYEDPVQREFEWIQANLPDIAPKSIGGYKRMKTSNSSNFQKVKAKAAEKGYEIQ